MSDEARTARLVGGASGGGGLPLSDAFRTICRRLLGSDPVPEQRLVITIARQLNIQRERVAATWGTWERLTADLLAQLEYAGMAARIATDSGDEWTLGSRFRTATRMYPIPGSNLWFAIYTEQEEVRRNAAAAVKLDLARARRVLGDAGMMTEEVTQTLAILDELLLFPESVQAAQVRKRTRPTVDHAKPRPPDEPDKTIVCRKCEQSKPKTKKHFEVYWHPNAGGDWHWRLACQGCRKEASERRVRDRREKVRQTVIRLHEQGVTPTVETVMEAAPGNRGDVIADWNYLARRSLVPVGIPDGVLKKRK